MSVRLVILPLLLFMAALAWWFWDGGAATDDEAAFGPVRRERPGAAPGSEPVSDVTRRGIPTDRFTKDDVPAPDRGPRGLRVRFVAEEGTDELPGGLTDVRASGWLGVGPSMTTPVLVIDGVSEPFLVPKGRAVFRVLLLGRVLEEFDVEVPPEARELVRVTPEMSRTVTGVLDDTEKGDIHEWELSYVGVGEEADLWVSDRAKVIPLDNGRWFADLDEDFSYLSVDLFARVDPAMRLVGPVKRRFVRSKPLVAGDCWDLGETSPAKPGVIARVRCTWPEVAPERSEERYLDLIFRKAGTPEHGDPQFSISVAYAPEGWFEIRGTSPWPRFEVRATYGEYQWSSAGPLSAGGEVVVDFDLTGAIIGRVVRSGGVVNSATIQVSAHGAGRTRTGLVRPERMQAGSAVVAIPGRGRFAFVDLPVGTWTIVARAFGGARVTRSGIEVTGTGNVTIDDLRIPETPTATRSLEVRGPDGGPLGSARVTMVDDMGTWSRPFDASNGIVTLRYPRGWDGRVMVTAAGHISRTVQLSALPDVIQLGRGVRVTVVFPMPVAELGGRAPVEVTAQARLKGTSEWGEVVIAVDEGEREGVYLGSWPVDAELQLRLMVTIIRRHQEPTVKFLDLGVVRVPTGTASFTYPVPGAVWERAAAAAR